MFVDKPTTAARVTEPAKAVTSPFRPASAVASAMERASPVARPIVPVQAAPAPEAAPVVAPAPSSLLPPVVTPPGEFPSCCPFLPLEDLK